MKEHGQENQVFREGKGRKGSLSLTKSIQRAKQTTLLTSQPENIHPPAPFLSQIPGLINKQILNKTLLACIILS